MAYGQADITFKIDNWRLAQAYILRRNPDLVEF